jgi:hypothetical protein
MAVALLSLNLADRYEGGELRGASGQDDQKLGALQFAAKLHEILMLASLGEIIFSYIRRELVFGDGVPFGAVSAGLKIDKMSFLYSPELWGVLRAKWGKKWNRWILSLILIISTLLGISVGPSTANLMRPRLSDWAAGGTTFWVNATSSTLSPRIVDTSQSLAHCWEDTGDQACPHGDWEAIERSYHAYWPQLQPQGSMPEFMHSPSPLSVREMVLRHRSTGRRQYNNITTQSIWQSPFTMVTVQHSVIADALAEVGRLWAVAAANSGKRRDFRYRKNALYTATAPQPITQSRCEEYVVPNSAVNVASLRFPVMPNTACNGTTGSCWLKPVDSLVYDNASLIDQVNDALLPDQAPTLIWIAPFNGSEALRNSINVVVTFPTTTTGGPVYYCCNIYSAIGNASITASRNLPKLVTGLPPGVLDIPIYDDRAKDWVKIEITPAWARLLNPKVAWQNATIFSRMASSAGMWNTRFVSHRYNFPFIVESILATMVTNGLARSTYNSTISGTLKGALPGDPWAGRLWRDLMLPDRGFGGGRPIYDLSESETATSTMFTMSATVYGYAWSRRGSDQKAFLAIIFVYTLLAFAHVSYLLLTGWTSTSWNTAPEIITLAMNSSPTEHLRNTGAGIDTVKPFQQNVKIRCRDKRLQYVFGDTSEGSDNIRPNLPYA